MSNKSAIQLLDSLINELEISISTKTDAKNLNLVDSQVGKLSVTESKPKEAKIKSAPKVADIPTEGEDVLDVNSIELRVGKIISVSKHETADKLYCEMIDVGESEPRAIASGLVHHYSLEEMLNRRIIVICNLLPRKLVGFKSNGMVLCAAKVDEVTGIEKVEFVDPPANAAVGERLIGESLKLRDALTAKQCDKKKAWETIAHDLKVNEQGILVWKDVVLVTQVTKETSIAPTLRSTIVR